MYKLSVDVLVCSLSQAQTRKHREEEKDISTI